MVQQLRRGHRRGASGSVKPGDGAPTATAEEGSAVDGHVFEDSHTSDFAVKKGTAYLADAGFPMCNALLVPYRGVCYHLKEWAKASHK